MRDPEPFARCAGEKLRYSSHFGIHDDLIRDSVQTLLEDGRREVCGRRFLAFPAEEFLRCVCRANRRDEEHKDNKDPNLSVVQQMGNPVDRLTM